MELEHTFIKVEIGMKENLRMIMEKERVYFIIQMEIDMKGNFIMVNHLVHMSNIQILIIK